MQQEYSQLPILPSPHFRWVVNLQNLYFRAAPCPTVGRAHPPVSALEEPPVAAHRRHLVAASGVGYWRKEGRPGGGGSWEGLGGTITVVYLVKLIVICIIGIFRIFSQKKYSCCFMNFHTSKMTKIELSMYSGNIPT